MARKFPDMHLPTNFQNTILFCFVLVLIWHLYGNKDIEYEFDKFPSEFRSIRVNFENES